MYQFVLLLLSNASVQGPFATYGALSYFLPDGFHAGPLDYSSFARNVSFTLADHAIRKGARIFPDEPLMARQPLRGIGELIATKVLNFQSLRNGQTLDGAFGTLHVDSRWIPSFGDNHVNLAA
eukprot:GHVH01000009.1.p1 GENE.GHVH01000009.1~~GHVH01000009.1.p1  ORF type:complete len:123 (+),score=5.59 GHVH01000009.1:116-484(+)